MSAGEALRRSPLKFFSLAFVLSIPFWLIGAVAAGSSRALPLGLPASALQLFCPLIAALILVHRENGLKGVKGLLGRVFDFNRIEHRIWYLPMVFLMPLRILVSYGLMRLMAMPLPEPHISLLMIPFLFLVFFITGVAEEVGWTGYATDPLQERWGALKAGIIIGSVWAVWHVVPDIQAHRDPTWIAWHRFGTVMTRIPMVWIYNNTGRSVFSAVVIHAMDNVSLYSFLNNGSHYNPAVAGVVMGVMAGMVVLLGRQERGVKGKG